MRGLLALAAVMCSVTDQTTIPTPPPEFPPEKGAPKDVNHCRINANTIFSWIVAVFDNHAQIIIGHGSMLTYRAFVSSCRQYTNPERGYTARGQYIWNLSQPLSPCGQERRVEGMYRHPKCSESLETATFFDYAVFKLVEPFAITGPTYPTLAFANSPTELLSGVQYVNVMPKTVGCILPSFLDQKARLPVFDWDTFVEAIPFHSQCVKMICERSPPNATFTAMCEKRIGERLNGTQLCFKYKNAERSITLGAGNTYWIAGTPLVCNSTTYGIATQAKLKKDNPHLSSDLHYVVTLIRVWEWLIGQLRQHSAPWVHHANIEDKDLKPEQFAEPNRPSIEGEKLAPNVKPHSDAFESTPSLKTIMFTLFLCCFYSQIF